MTKLNLFLILVFVLLGINNIEATAQEKSLQERLIDDLQSKNDSVRIRAIYGLAQIGDKTSVLALVNVLISDPNKYVRKDAAAVLGKLGEHQLGIPALKEALTDEYVLVRFESALSLAQLGDKSGIHELSKALDRLDSDRLDRENYALRSKIVDALDVLDDPETVPALSKVLLNDPEEELRIRTAKVLTEIVDKSVINTFYQALNDKSWKVGDVIVPGLLKHDDKGYLIADRSFLKIALIKTFKEGRDWRYMKKLTAALVVLADQSDIPALSEIANSDNKWVRDEAARLLGKLETKFKDGSAMSALCKVLNDKNPVVALEAAKVLLKLESQAGIPYLKEALNNRSSRVRRAVAIYLGKLGIKEAVPALIEVLQAPNVIVYTRKIHTHLDASKLLGKFGDRSAVPILIKTILEHSRYQVRAAAVNSLGKLGDVSAVPALTRALNDENIHTRKNAAKALRKLGSKTAVAALIDSLKDPNPDIRLSAADALGKFGDQSAMPALTEALKDSDPRVRKKVVEAMGRLKTGVAPEEVEQVTKDTTAEVKPERKKVLFDQNKMEILKKMRDLNNPDKTVRLETVSFLANSGDSSVLPALTEALKDESPEVRKKAAFGLGKMGDKSATSYLTESLKDKDWSVRLSAVEALGTLNDPSAIPSLKKCLNDSNENVRKKAAEILKQLQ